MKSKKKTSKNIPTKAASKAASIKEYAQTLLDLKKRIQEAQVKATFAANKELIKLYWHIGKTIAEKQEISGWGFKHCRADNKVKSHGNVIYARA